MARYYGKRYLRVDDFIKYCEELNIKIEKIELEYYEKTGAMMPVVRVVYPDDFVIKNTLWSLNPTNSPPKMDQWPELQRLVEKLRVQPEDWADLPNDELIDSFDREMGQNRYIARPTPENYRPWSDYTIFVPFQDGQQLRRSTADHYYSYWQVHQLYYLQQYPDLYQNRVLLDEIPEEVNRRIHRPWVPPEENLREFKGMARLFDALSFWITMYTRESQRTFALVPEKYRVKHLDEPQFQDFRRRIAADGKLVQSRFGLALDKLYEFLYQLIKLSKEYRGLERHKLSEEIRNDVLHLAQFMGVLAGLDGEAIADELGKQHGPWVKQSFRHLDKFLLVDDTAHDVFTYFRPEYNRSFPHDTLTPQEVGRLEQFIREKGLFLINYAIFDVQEVLNNPGPFTKTLFYIAVKNLTTGFECLLREISKVAKNRQIDDRTLFTLTKTFFDWGDAFEREHQRKKDAAKADDIWYIDDVYIDPKIDNNLRNFMIAHCGRNLLAHKYSIEDQLHHDIYNRVYLATIFSLFYSWKYALTNGWV